MALEDARAAAQKLPAGTAERYACDAALGLTKKRGDVIDPVPSGHRWSSKVLHAMAAGLAVNTKARILSLQYKELSAKGARHLAAGIARNKGLRQVQ